MSNNSKQHARWPDVDTPCIGFCSTALGDDLCRGCGRTAQEVDGWIFMSDPEKAVVWDRVEKAGVGMRWESNT